MTSDLDPFDGDSVKIANQLIEKLFAPDEAGELGKKLYTENIQLPERETDESLEEYEQSTLDNVVSDLPESRTAPSPSPDQGESPNTSGKTISLDLMKMSHHGREYNNPSYFLTSLNPKTVVVTGPISWVTEDKRVMKELNGAHVFSTCSNSSAVVATITSEGITTDYVTTVPCWSWIDGALYYFDYRGRTYYEGGNIQTVDGKKYFFERRGNVLTGIGDWQYDGESYFITEDGSFLKWLAPGC